MAGLGRIGRNWRYRSASFLVAAGFLSACGGETPESLQLAVAEPLSRVESIDESERGCVAESVVSTVGFDELVASGFTSESIVETPEDSLQQILAAGDRERLLDRAEPCVDINRVAGQQLMGGEGGELLCDASFQDTALGRTILENELFGFEDGVAPIVDSQENRDLLRACVDEEVFADLFDVDLRTDLERAIDAQFVGTLLVVERPCVGPLVVAHYGSAEATNEAGISQKQPAIDLDALGFEENSRKVSFIDAVIDCGQLADIIEQEARSQEPAFADCIIEHATSSSSDFYLQERNHFNLRQRVQAEFGVESAMVNVQRSRETTADYCLNDRVQQEFGTTFPLSEASFLGSELFQGAVEFDPAAAQFGYTENDFRCAAVEVVQTIDLDRYLQLANAEDPNNPSAEFSNLQEQFHGAVVAGLDRCAHDALYLLIPAVERNFDSDTVRCVREAMGSTTEELLASFRQLNNDFTIRFDEFERRRAELQREIIIPVEQCHAPYEAEAYEEWFSWFTTFAPSGDLGEPDSLSS